MNYYKHLIRPLLFCLPAETAHDLSIKLLKNISILPTLSDSFKTTPTELFGIHFKNKVGLAAGLDKNASAVVQLSNLGFGFVEIGTVTPKPQLGNPLPRLFRLPKDLAVINRMGFNNLGVDIISNRLKTIRKKNENIIIGGNIGKNKTTPNELAWKDYLECFIKLFDYINYFTVNVSSPNTPNLRDLQEGNTLLILLEKLQNFNQNQKKSKPILLKISPDLDNKAIDTILKVVQTTGVDAIITCNTTTSRPIVKSDLEIVKKIGSGGLSGLPLYKKSNASIAYINQKMKGKLPIIGVGGIMNKSQAIEKISLGANLIQLYTGFIYEGWSLLHSILREFENESLS